MNVETISFVLTYWWWVVPSLLVLATLAAWVIIPTAFCWYSYVFQVEVQKGKSCKLMAKLIYKAYSDSLYGDKKEYQPWVLLRPLAGFGKVEEGEIFFGTLIVAATSIIPCGILYLLPIEAGIAVGCFLGGSVLMKHVVALGKKAAAISKALDAHVEDKDAHKG